MTHCNSKSGTSSKSSLAKLLGQKTNSIQYQLLEPRMVFDGAAAVAVADMADAGSDAAPVDAAANSSHAENLQDLVAALAAGGLATSPGLPAPGASSAIVFIDGAVTNPGVLANTAPAGAEVVVLNRGSDGLAQIAHYLQGRSGIDAIHIISHGHSGELTLGNAVVDETSIGGTHADELNIIRAALSDDADIALYGCSVGQGAEGQAFIDALSRATGADIAASVDDTGSLSHNANWNLEVRTGLIEAGLIGAPEWNGILAPLEIRVSGNPVLHNSAGGTSDPFNSAGNTALWTNAGTIGSTQIDVRATVLSTSAFSGAYPTYVDFITSNVEDLQVILWNGSATIKWEIFASGTNQLVYAVGSPNFSIRDLDGTGSAAFPALPAVELEAVSPQLQGLTSYTLEGDPLAPNTLNAGVVGGELIVAGTINRNLETNSMVTFSWTEVSSWVVRYTGQTAFINPDNTISPRFFYHDGDGDFTFVSPTTTLLLAIDLDVNNSTATGASYQTTFSENGAAVAVVDSDVVITQQAVLGTPIHEATVRLTNPQTGDALLVNGSAAASGTITAGSSTLNYTVSSTGGQINVVFTGTATPADYQSALQSVTFSNANDNLSGVDRSIEVFVKNTTFGTSSNQALSTIHVTPVNDAPLIDLNSAASLADANRDHSVTFTEGDTPVKVAALAADVNDITEADVTKLTIVAAGVADGAFEKVVIAGKAFDLATSSTQTATVGGTTVSIAYVASTGTFTITNSAGATTPMAQADLDTIVRGITYENTDQAPVAGDRTLTFTATDSGGLTSGPAVATITVVPVNDTPIIDLNSAAITTDTARDHPVTFTEGDAPIKVAALAADVSDITEADVTKLTIVAAGVADGTSEKVVIAGKTFDLATDSTQTATVGGTAVSITYVAATGTFTITNDAGAALPMAQADLDTLIRGITYENISQVPVAGDRTLTFAATDSGGLTSAPAVATITVVPANDNPVAVNDTGSASEDGPATTGNVINGPGTDTDIDGGPLSVTLANQAGTPITIGAPFTLSGGGTLTLNANGSYIFDPGIAYNSLKATETATETISYTVSDGHGGAATATLVITINGANDAPIAVDDHVVSLPTNGPVLNIGGGFEGLTGAPNPGYPLSPYSFTVGGWSATNTDGEVLTAEPGRPAFEGNQYISLLQNAGQNPGTAWNETSSTFGGFDRAVTILNVVPGQTYTISFAHAGDNRYGYTGNTTLVQIQSMNTTQEQSNAFVTPGLFNWQQQTVTFTADAGTSQIALLFSAMGTANSSALIDAVTVTQVIPGATGPYVTPEDTAITIIPMTNDSDPDGDPIHITHVEGQPITAGGAAVATAHGTVSLSSDGLTFTFAPSLNYFGPADFTYTIADPSGLTSTAIVDIEVTPVNDAPGAVADIGSVSEDGPAATGNVITGLGTDTDIDGGPLTVTLASQAGAPIIVGTPFTTAGGGTLTLNANGSYSFDPGTAYNGLDITETATETISYTISDGNGGTAIAMLVITINGANDEPVVIDPANPGTTSNPIPATDPLNIIPDVSRNDGQALTPINVGSYIVDPDGEPLTFTVDATTPSWISINPVTGIITGTPPSDASQASNTGNPGEYLITVTATDPDGTLVTTTVTLTIVNLPPVAVNDMGSVSEDGPTATGNVLTDSTTGDHDTTPDSDPLTVVAINGDPALVGEPVAGSTGGSFMLNPDGSWSFDPGHDFDNLAAGATRDTVITYRVADGQGGTADATITVTVTGVNDAPVALGPIPPQTVTDNLAISPINTSLAFANPSHIPLTYTASNLPDGLAINPMTGVISGTPASDASIQGPYIVTVVASGPNGETSTVQLQLNVANPPPVATDDHATTPVNTAVTIAPLANDNDPDGDDLIITAITPPANGTAAINPDGTISYIPNAAFTGTETITYTVTDSQGGTTTATTTVTVGTPPADAPVVNGMIPPQAGTDNLPITPINAGSLFSDPNGGPLTFTATGLPQGLVIDPVTGIITGTVEPDASIDGPYAITVTAVDPDGNQVTTTVLLAVLNPAAVAANDATATPVDTPVKIAALANDMDPDGDVLHVSFVSDPAHGTVTINPDGTITYTPDAGFSGTDIFSYTVSDGQGGSDIATVTISVGAPLAGAPVAAGPLAPVTGVDGTPIAPLNIGSQITDPTGQPLTFSATGLPNGLVIDPLTGIITGTFKPGASEEGPFTVLITAVDPDGNQVTVPLVITAINPVPVAGNDTATTAADQAVIIGVLANDRDPDGDVVTVTAATDPAHGSVVINPNGTITFTPDAGFTGTDTFTYTLTDANGATTAATVTVNIGTPGPLAVAPAISSVIAQDGTTITPLPVGNAFGDPDQTGPLTLSVDPSALPPGIRFDPASGTFSGTPANNASQGSTPGEPTGTYIVPVTATDSHGETTTTYVTFTFSNLPPVAVNDTATASEDAAHITGNVLTDPITGDHDTAPDSDPVMVTLASQGGRPIVLGTPFTVAGGGVLTLHSNGAYTFIPGTAYNGLDAGASAIETISYTISDGNGGSATATLVITVTGVNDAPVVVDPRNPGTPANPTPATDPLNIIPDVKTADSRSPAPVNVANYIRDPEGKPLTFAATGLPPGLSINRNTGVITGTVSHSASQGATQGNAPGVYTVIVTARDPGGLETTTTITYTVANPPPVAVNDGQFVTDENRTVTVPVLGNDIDPDGDPLRVTAASSPNGTVTINGDGSLSFAPAPGFAGTALITYVISDGEGGTSLATVEVAVRPVVIGLSQSPVRPLPPVFRSPHEPISVDGAVLAAANASYNLYGVGGTAGLSMANVIGESASVMGVINALDVRGSLWSMDQSGSLGGEPSFLTSDGIVLAESAHINGLWQAGDMLRSPDLSSLGLGTLGGFSIRFSTTLLEPGAPSGPEVLVDSIVHNGVLTLTFEQSGMVPKSRVVDYRITRLDGRPIPDWLERSSIDMLQGRRAADAEILDLRITAILSNGEAVTQDIRIQTMTGEIQPLPRQRAGLSPPMFQDQFRSYASLSDRQSAALAYAIAD